MLPTNFAFVVAVATAAVVVATAIIIWTSLSNRRGIYECDDSA